MVMTKIKTLFAGLTVALASWLTAGSAYAQNAHSWVSASTGSGAACTRAAPCATISNAQTVTNQGGVISVLDPFDNSPSGVIITKSLTIRAEGVDGGATSTSGGGFWIVVEAGATDVVTLEGLHLGGAGGGIIPFICTSSDASSRIATFPAASGFSFARSALAN
jgi:hypothetical protein